MILSIAQFLFYLLIIFVVYLVGKSIVFYMKSGINPVLFSTYSNRVQFFAWMGLMIVLVLYGLFIVMMWQGKDIGETFYFLPNIEVNFIGVLFIIVGFVMMFLAQTQMGREWRMGFDTTGEVHLVTRGLFSISRNPVYTAILMQTLGTFLLMKVMAGLMLWVVHLLFVIVIIRTEERFLREKFGDSYLEYKKKVRRFL